METNLEVIVNSEAIVAVTVIIVTIAMEAVINSVIVTTSLAIDNAEIVNMATNSMTRKVSMTESHVILFQPEIGSSCLRIFRSDPPAVSTCMPLLVMTKMLLHHQSKKEVPICSFQLSLLQSICQSVDAMVSTVLIRLPNHKVLFDSFVKRKLRLPKPHGLVSMEFSYLFNNKMSYV